VFIYVGFALWLEDMKYYIFMLWTVAHLTAIAKTFFFYGILVFIVFLIFLFIYFFSYLTVRHAYKPT